MNIFALIACKRVPKVSVPRETLWTRTNRYHKKASGSVEGIAKTAVPQPRGAGGPAPPEPHLSESQ
jgi:hypothetical protein